MNSFLWSIVSNDGVDNELTRYTRDFFSQHLNLDELITLLRLKTNYILISRLIKDRFKSNVVKSIESNNKDVLEVQKEIEVLLSELRRLESKRQEISNKEKALYDSEKYDSIELGKLEKEMSEVTNQIAEKQGKAKRLFDKKNSLMGQKRKNDELKNKYNRKVKEEFDELSKFYNSVNFDNLSQLECFKSKKILAQYEDGLKKIIPNDLERRTYMEYFTRVVNCEVKSLLDVVKVSEQYLKTSNEENEYHMPELDRRNTQIENLDLLLNHYCYNVVMFLNGKDTNMAIVNSFREIKGFVDESLDYASNFEKYGTDQKAEKEKYDRLNRMYAAFYEKYVKKKPRILGIIRKKGYDSIESIAYHDVVINGFEHILTYVYEDVKNELKDKSKPTLKATETINPKFKPAETINPKFKPAVQRGTIQLVPDKVDEEIVEVISEMEGPKK